MDVGHTIAGQYCIQSLAGTGGMGKVYHAKDEASGSEVAIKVLSLDAANYSRRFLREAEVMAQLRHDSIVGYLDYGHTEDGAPFIVMEWVEGEDLRQRMNRKPITLAEALQIVAGVGDALAFADSRGVIHRDLKPSNLMLVNGNLDTIKLLDFGIARWRSPDVERMTNTGIGIGTPGYMAPEQSRGDSEFDGRADIYALGCVIYECLVGQRPFQGEDIIKVLTRSKTDQPPRVSAHRADISEAFDDLLTHMMAFRADERPLNGTVVARRASSISPIRLLPSSSLDESLPPIQGKRGKISNGEREPLCIILSDSELEFAVEHLNSNHCADHQHFSFDNGTNAIVIRSNRDFDDKLLLLVVRAAISGREKSPDSPLSIRLEFGDWNDSREIRKIAQRRTHTVPNAHTVQPALSILFSADCALLLRDCFSFKQKTSEPEKYELHSLVNANQYAKSCEFILPRTNPLLLEYLLFTDFADEAPPAILATLHLPLREYSHAQRKYIRVASLFGKIFQHRDVRFILNCTDATANVFLQESLKTGEIQPADDGNDTYQFRSEFFRRTAYATLTNLDQMVGHRLAAQWFIERASHDDEQLGAQQTLKIARHFAIGQQLPLAVQYFAMSGLESIAYRNYPAAIHAAEEGLQLNAPEKSKLHALLVRAALWSGSISLASEHGITEIENNPDNPKQWLPLAGDTIVALNDCAAHIDITNIAIGLLKIKPVNPSHQSLRVSALAQAASSLYSAKQVNEANRIMKSLADVEDVDSEPIETQGYLFFASALRQLYLGDLCGHWKFLLKSLAHLSDSENVHAATVARIHLGVAHSRFGEWRQAEIELRTVLEMATTSNLEFLVANARSELGKLLTIQGHWEDSEMFLRSAITWFSQHKNEGGLHQARVYLSQLYQKLGKMKRAETEVRSALIGTSTISAVRMQANVQLASILLQMGRPNEALTCVLACCESSSNLRDIAHDESAYNLVLIEALMHCNRHDEARSTLETVYAHLLRRANRIDIPERQLSFIEKIPENARIVDLAVRMATIGG